MPDFGHARPCGVDRRGRGPDLRQRRPRGPPLSRALERRQVTGHQSYEIAECPEYKDLFLGQVFSAIDQAMEEHPPPYVSQANGKVEAAVKSVRGMTRTLQVALEDQLKSKIPATHAIMHWLVGHAADILTWRIRGVDGLTAYQRARGKPFVYKLVGFGEYC